MSLHILSDKIEFPNVESASRDGLLAVGGDLSTERLLLAYQSGIFPWFNEGEPILWWSPNPRFVLFPDKLKVSKSMKQVFRKEQFKITVSTSFETVIDNCSKIRRNERWGTWITTSMREAYIQLHQLGYAKSVEVWQDEQLVGGLYGVDVGNGVFCGESMFSKVSNASKAGFIWFVQNSNYRLIDCQVHTKHLESFGAQLIPRKAFMEYL